jgi:hypothetical protein
MPLLGHAIHPPPSRSHSNDAEADFDAYVKFTGRLETVPLGPPVIIVDGGAVDGGGGLPVGGATTVAPGIGVPTPGGQGACLVSDRRHPLLLKTKPPAPTLAVSNS